MTIQELHDRAEPGPWRTLLSRIIQAEADHLALWETHKAAYETYYDTPEPRRSFLDAGEAEAAAAVETSSAAIGELRNGIYPARVAAFAAKAAEFGAEAPRDGEPDWVRLMRDLHALREWRMDHLDGVDLHLPPFLLRKPSKDRPGMFDEAFKAWSKAAGLKPEEIRYRVLRLATAGLLPGVADSAEPTGFTLPTDEGVTLAIMIEFEGTDALLAEVRCAEQTLPPASFPVPREMITALSALDGARP